MCKQLLKLFGFPFHIAPGEAEAECALLQREGMVDAVLSEDVDTLMFGCGLTLRNWSSEGQKGNKSPTHVSLYDAKVTKEGKAGLDREGMVLIALMSGGDYITEGIPGAGIKVACEAARAGFGKSLCQLLRSDLEGLEDWRKNLSHELRTNENKFFRCKHKSLIIPDNFPNKEVLAYYTHPVVSSASKIQKLKESICWDGEIDISGLRLFVSEAFDWTHKIGATKFIRGLAPVLLVHKLRTRGDRRDSGYGDLILTAMNEMQLVRAICGKRTHFSTDGIPELRVVYHPNDIVGLDLDAEEDDNEDYGRDGLAPQNEDDEIEAYTSDTAVQQSDTLIQRGPSLYDPTQPDKLWIPETIAQLGIPLKVEDYEESLRNPKKFLKAKSMAKKAASKRPKSTKGGMPVGALDKFVQVSKPNVYKISKTPQDLSILDVASTRSVPSSNVCESASKEPTASHSSSSKLPSSAKVKVSLPTQTSAKVPTNRIIPKIKSSVKYLERPNCVMNPWTLAASSPSTPAGPTVTKNISSNDKQNITSPSAICIPTLISSSPPLPPTSPSRKHATSPLPENEVELDMHTLSHCANTNQLLPSTSFGNERTLPRKKPTPPKPPIADSPTPDSFRILTPRSVNRRIDFTSELRSEESSQSPPPLVGELLSALPPATQERDKNENTVSTVIDILSSPEIPIDSRINLSPRRPPRSPTGVREKRPKKDKKYIMLRDSLPGQWSLAQESQVLKGNRRAWRVSQVEVLDLTSV